jgi:hypothetical protein
MKKIEAPSFTFQVPASSPSPAPTVMPTPVSMSPLSIEAALDAKLPQIKLRQPTDAQTFQCAKLSQPKLRQSTDVQRSQRTLRATQARCALVRAHAELLQNMPLWRLL